MSAPPCFLKGRYLSSWIIVSANSLWNVANFRTGLLKSIEATGHPVLVAAPADGSTLPAGSHSKISDLPIDRSGLNPFADALLLVRYYRLFSELRPAAFLSFTIKPNIYGSIAARLAGVPAIANVSGLGTAFMRDGLFARFVGSLYRLAFAKAHKVFFQNPDDRRLFLDRKIVREARTGLLPGSGIDLDRFTPAGPAPHGPPIFLLIARMLTDKGVGEFVEAAAMVKARHPGARFQLLGGLDPGNRTAIGEEEIRRWGREGVVEYLGPAEDVRPFIAGASAVVLPSYREGLPRSLLEGAAIGRPLIATDVPGCREIVKDGVTGLLCQVRSASSLAAAMARFAEMGVDQREALGKAARAKVEAEFSERAVIDAYLAALRPLIRGAAA